VHLAPDIWGPTRKINGYGEWRAAFEKVLDMHLQGEYEAAKAEYDVLDLELKALRSGRPARVNAFVKARDLQVGTGGTR
jgi:hypothetical protein